MYEISMSRRNDRGAGGGERVSRAAGEEETGLTAAKSRGYHGRKAKGGAGKQVGGRFS